MEDNQRENLQSELRIIEQKIRQIDSQISELRTKELKAKSLGRNLAPNEQLKLEQLLGIVKQLRADQRLKTEMLSRLPVN